MTIIKITSILLAVTLFLLSTVCVQALRPYINNAVCPRKPELAQQRQCLKKCRTDRDCRGRSRKCLCDDVCGKACVKPSQRCEPLKPIFNGEYHLDTYNVFRGKVTYTCNNGYALRGKSERICQGDGYWSGDAPPHCEEEGSMSDTVMVPNLGKCTNPPHVQYASHDGPTGQKAFSLGIQLNYKCETGYNIDGFFRSMCVGDGRWVGPRMTCSPRRCGHPGDIENAGREGNAFVYPNKVVYTCNDGYEMLGRSYRVCTATGEWSGMLPTCIPTKCPKLKSPPNGDMTGTNNTYGAIVYFSCRRGFEIKGSTTRMCETNGVWTGTEVQCIQVDCGQPGPFYIGYLDGSSTTYGSEYQFRCYGRTTFEGPSLFTVCQENGRWSHPVPKCWLKCQLPSIDNGTLILNDTKEDFEKHGSVLKANCSEGHVLNTTEEPRCHNGSWTFEPKCIPAACTKRPSDLRDGYVRFYTMNHGDRAKYKCNTGYRLHGDEYVTCQYGQWVGTQAMCQEVYCQYPGSIDKGIVLLVGRLAKYEYREYVRKTEHNQEIEFSCDKGYRRVGSAGATCVDGKWSPPEMPECIPKQHPKLLYIFRGKRSLGDAGRHSLGGGGGAVVADDDAETSEEKGLCEVPDIDFAMESSQPIGYFVPHYTTLEVTCSPGYSAVPRGFSLCDDGVWMNQSSCHLESETRPKFTLLQRMRTTKGDDTVEVT